MNAVQQKIASIICFLLRNFLGLILSFSFIFDVWLSSGLDKGHQWWNWSRHQCTSTKLYSLGWQVILAASKKHVSNGDTIQKATKPGIGMIVSGNKYVILISNIGMQPVWKLGWPWLTMARVSWFKHIPKKQVCHLKISGCVWKEGTPKPYDWSSFSYQLKPFNFMDIPWYTPFSDTAWHRQSFSVQQSGAIQYIQSVQMALSENELIILKSHGLSSCHIYDSWGYVPFSHKACANGSSMLQSFMTTLAVWRTAMGKIRLPYQPASLTSSSCQLAVANLTNPK